MLRLLALLLLCGLVWSRELECDELKNDRYCFQLKTHMFYNCWLCKIKSQQISEANEVITISGKLGNGTVVDVEFVQFVGGDVTKMPITIDKTTSQQIVRVEINGTGTKELSSEFFGNSGQHLKYFVNCENNNVSVKASAFQNFTNLEILDLSYNMISSIPPDTFTRLDKLIRLELGQNQLSVVLHSWFRDLGNLELLVLYKNRLVEIPENAFDSLRKLKWLDLKDNYIEILRRNTFQKNEMLIGIYLQFNHIKEIQVGSFEHLSQLTELGLEGNNCINDTFDTETLLKIAEALSPCYPPVCRVPIILNGIIVRIDDNSTKLAGELFEGSGSVKVVCDPTFTKFHDKANQTTNKCVKDNWEDLQWPTCQKLCPRQEIIDESFLSFCDRDGEDFPCSNHLRPGTKATIRCQTGFMNPKDLVNSELTCQESGNWSHQAHKCEPISKNVTEISTPVQIEVSCPHQEISGPSIKSYCERDGEDSSCSGNLLPGTKAMIRCHTGYKQPPRFKTTLTCQESGNWSHSAFECEPICGRVAGHSVPLQFGGKDTNVTEVPWHVGIYENDTQICGGTIISERVVITAAHCFSTNTKNNHSIDYKTFKVAAGKIARGLYERETQETQIRDVLEVDISLKYDGSDTWWADIATILVEGYFEYQQHIVPACVHFIENNEEWYPKNESRALVAGWGLAKDGNPSDILQSFDIPVVDFVMCEENAPWEFQAKVVEDKICAGFVDPNERYSKVVCRGDSGGGLLIPQTVGSEKRYFLQGVVSNSQQTKDCDKTYYTLFTNIQHYRNIIKKALNKKFLKFA